MKKVLLSVLLLQGCAINPPYPDWMLKEADVYISKIAYLPDAELQETCTFELRVSGCSKLAVGEIYILDGYGDEFRECVLRHERSHFYEVYVRKTQYADSQRHKHWIDTKCYVPRHVTLL